MLVDKYLTELSLLAKEICPEAKIEATTETFEDEDGHIRVYPPAGISAEEIEEVEGKIASRCVDILLEGGCFDLRCCLRLMEKLRYCSCRVTVKYKGKDLTLNLVADHSSLTEVWHGEYR